MKNTKLIILVAVVAVILLFMRRRDNFGLKCPSGKEKIGNLCYTPCDPGWITQGVDCVQTKQRPAPTPMIFTT